uniref:DNA mismatch repair protein MutL n=1 Tax=candidate division WOR-3 bacterium TaxID=2052148 RepID=A0A7C3YSG6_UNCW3
MRIKPLPEETIKKIAAGEVILRPASVVKELIENSIDAQARRIEIELKGGGKNLIRVIDDGIGMSRDDCRLAISRYTTSKIERIEDLSSLKTFGFRGEALASIASVSRLKIETNDREDSPGTYLFADGGEIKEIKEIARKVGTTITVSELFFNLPVRRGFLKSENYELRLIIDQIKNYALVFPEVSFSLKNDDKVLFTWPRANTVKDRLISLLERRVFDSLIEFHFENPLLSLSGFISRPEEAKTVYEIQAIYFNRRPVKNRTVSKAIMEGYGGTLRGMNPNYLIFLTTAPENLDCNIHPTKLEVRFADEKFLFDFLSEAIRKTLGIQKKEELAFDDFLYQGEIISEEKPSTFWQLHNSYIFAAVKGGYCIIDQHAASERIIYEEVLQFERKPTPQPLLFPMILELPPEVFLVYEEIKETLSSLGIETKVFGEKTIVVEAVSPNARFSEGDLKELLSELSKMEKSVRSHREEIAKVIACHGAIKAGERLSQEAMERLINRLFACETPYFCPHGRPVIIKFNLNELEKKFGRI